jgi:hypothetical protein
LTIKKKTLISRRCLRILRATTTKWKRKIQLRTWSLLSLLGWKAEYPNHSALTLSCLNKIPPQILKESNQNWPEVEL